MFKIESYQLNKGNILNRNFSSEYGYIYIISGSIKFTLNDLSCVKLGQYHYFLFTPYDFIKMEAPIDSEIYIMRYKKSFVTNNGGKNKFIEIFDFDKENLNNHICHSDYQNFMFLKLFVSRYNYVKETPFKYSDVYLESIANLTLINLNNAVITTNTTKVKARKLSIDEILLYIRENISTSFTVQDIADYFGVTTSYLSNFYHKTTEVTLSRTIIEYRLHKAIKYIKNGKSVQEVYQLVGFNSYNHFFKIFKEYYNMSPLQYVKTLEDE